MDLSNVALPIYSQANSRTNRASIASRNPLRLRDGVDPNYTRGSSTTEQGAGRRVDTGRLPTQPQPKINKSHRPNVVGTMSTGHQLNKGQDSGSNAGKPYLHMKSSTSSSGRTNPGKKPSPPPPAPAITATSQVVGPISL